MSDEPSPVWTAILERVWKAQDAIRHEKELSDKRSIGYANDFKGILERVDADKRGTEDRLRALYQALTAVEKELRESIPAKELPPKRDEAAKGKK